MGNAIYSQEAVCHDTLESCRAHCDKSECVFVNHCNDKGEKFVCMLIDMRFLSWIVIGCFLLVLCVCSSLVTCYICRAIRASFRNAERTDGDIIFTNPGRVHHVQMPRQKHGERR